MVASHLFRLALLKKDSFLEKPRTLFPSAPKAINPFLFRGGQNVEPPCYGAQPCLDEIIASFPTSVKDEMSANDKAKKNVDDYQKSIAHPWMTLGQVFDQSMLGSEIGTNNKMHYWSDLTFEPKWYHESFFVIHRLVARAEYFVKERATPLYPVVSSFFQEKDMHPLLDGVRINLGHVRMLPDAKGTSPHLIVYKANLIRMVLYLQSELLQQGATIYEGELVGADHGLSLNDQVGNLDELSTTVATWLKDSESADYLRALTAADQAFAQGIGGPQGLLADVTKRLQAAPKKPRP